MKKFWLSIMFEVILMVQFAVVIYNMQITVDLEEATFSVNIPYALIIAGLVFLTVIINYYIFNKLKVARATDAPLILKSHDEREQAIINKYAVLGFAYITPIIVVSGAVFIAVGIAFISDIEAILKLIGYAIILFIGLPFIIHALLVIREIRKV